MIPTMNGPVKLKQRIVPTMRRSNCREACLPQLQMHPLACLPSDTCHTCAGSAYSLRSLTHAGPDAHKSGCTSRRMGSSFSGHRGTLRVGKWQVQVHRGGSLELVQLIVAESLVSSAVVIEGVATFAK